MDLDERIEKEIRLIHELELSINGTDEEFQAEWEKFLGNMLEIYPEMLTGNKAKFTDEERAIAKREWDICFALVNKRSDERAAKLKRELAKEKRKNAKQAFELEKQKQVIETLSDYSKHPNNALYSFTEGVLHSPDKSEHSKVEVRLYSVLGTREFIYKGLSGEYSLTLDALLSKIPNGAKVFSFISMKMNESRYIEKTPFQLQELVDLGIYKTIESAYKGVKNILEKCSKMIIGGKSFDYDKKGKPIERVSEGGALVSWYKVTFNDCHVTLPAIFRDLKPQIAELPRWIYSLKDSDFMLAKYLHSLPRTQKKKSLYIKIETIRQHLGYPSVEEVRTKHNRRYRQLIIEPLQAAIERVTAAANNAAQEGESDIKITQVYDGCNVDLTKNDNVDFIDSANKYLEGSIHVELSGEPAAYIAERAKDTKHEQQAKERRINKIIAAKAAEKQANKENTNAE
ncbi:hypothetical protein AGMMS50276_29490 [Synergistales bacterium]|nr:hypothetical protein AGMMS50276_29490 [Synergistales bacterium]